MTPERKGKEPRQEAESPLRFEKGAAGTEPRAKGRPDGAWKKTAARMVKEQQSPAPAANDGRELSPEPTVGSVPTGPEAHPADESPRRYEDDTGPEAEPNGPKPGQAGDNAGRDNGTSGQNVPKLRQHSKRENPSDAGAQKQKFRQDSGQPRPSDRLRRDGGNPAVPNGAPAQAQRSGLRGEKEAQGSGRSFRHQAETEQSGLCADAPDKLRKSRQRMEYRQSKLETATDRLARQKPRKPPGPVKQAASLAGWSVHGFVHGKIYENEHENVGIEAAHRSELVGEAAGRGALRFTKRRVRQHPARAAQKAERRYIRATADHHFQQAALEHPEMGADPVTRLWRKHQQRKQFQRRAKEAAKQSANAARQGTRAAEKAASTVEAAGRAVAGFVKRHPGGTAIALLVVVLLVVMQSCTSSLVAVGNGIGGGVAAATYPAEDADLLGAEAAYCAMEADLQNYLDTYEAAHDYDEYHFDLDDIEHDPYVLLSILSALHGDGWTLADVEDELQAIFDRQYILTETVTPETRYRTELQEGEEVEVPYTWYVCTVTLENTDLSHLPVYIMGEEQLSRYAIFMASLGNRPDLFPGSAYVGRYTGDTTTPAYTVPPEALEDEQFAAMLAEAEKYLGYPYVWGGASPSTSFDCSGFVSWVINHSGWNVGRLGAMALCDICTPVRDPKPGDLVFFWHTYDAPYPDKPTHVGIYVGDGWMIHCGDPIQYANLNTSYWREHFYCYGRLP